MQEPPDGTVVIGTHERNDNQAVHLLWHRDDREGHGDPAHAPQRWWSYAVFHWMSWKDVVDVAKYSNVQLAVVHSVPLEPVASHTYLSTACLHLHHDQCGKQQHDHVDDQGHPHCKWCPAPCICGCHGGN